MERCPKCRSNRVHRSPLKGLVEHARRQFTAKRPYRCATCGWRGWAPVPREHTQAIIPGSLDGPEPDLSAIDRQMNKDGDGMKSGGDSIKSG